MASNYIELPPNTGGGGGGAVISVNGQTGVVVLNKTDIGLGNVPNVDATNMNNASAGTLAVAHGGTGSTQLADATHQGAISAADWNTFNNKQASGNYITALTGDVTATGPGSVAATIANLAVTNAKIANNTIDLTTKVTGVLPIANGGTGQAVTPTNGQLLIGKTSTNNFVLSTLTAGAGISIANGSGSITITNTYLSGTINIDGGQANSIYGGISPIDGGNA